MSRSHNFHAPYVFANGKHYRYLVKSTFGQEADTHSFTEMTEDAPIVTLWHCLLFQILGWPLYMLDNLSGQKGASGFPRYSHYWFGADSALYKESELFSIFLSDLGVAASCIVLFLAAQVFSVWTVLIFYGIPYLWLNQWVGMFILPHYPCSCGYPPANKPMIDC